MRKLLFILFIFFALYAKGTGVVNIYNDTTINGTWNLSNRVLNIYGKISGQCTITNAFIEANPFIQIFDTSVNIGAGCRIREFSVMWYGAVNGAFDSYYAIQKSIDQCKDRYSLYLPRNTYTINSPLLIANYNSSTGRYGQTSIKMYGEAAMWDDNSGTKIVYNGNGYALGMQLNKGSEISNLIIQGGWVSPSGADTSYFNISEANYVNQSATGNGQGIWIDPYYDGSNSGSTGCKFHDLYIKNFNSLIQVSNSNGTQNGEIMSFKDIQFGNAKYGVVSSQPQEKMNVIDGVHSWGAIYELFKIQSGGNYYISNVNVAGWSIQLWDIVAAGYFPCYVDNIYAEHFARIGRFSGFLPMNVKNSIFDFAYPSQAKTQKLLDVGFSASRVKFDNCLFRYYGQGYDLDFPARGAFNNCFFSGALTDTIAGASFLDYSQGAQFISSKITVTNSNDTVIVNNVRLSVKTFNHQ